MFICMMMIMMMMIMFNVDDDDDNEVMKAFYPYEAANTDKLLKWVLMIIHLFQLHIYVENDLKENVR